MLREQFEKIMSKYHGGTYIHIEWKNVTSNGIKYSKGAVRITHKEIEVSKKGDEYIRIRTTKNPHHRIQTTYFNHNGEVITREEFLGDSKNYTIDEFFSKHLDDIIKLGK